MHFVLDEKVFGQKIFFVSYFIAFIMKVWKFALKILFKGSSTFVTKYCLQICSSGGDYRIRAIKTEFLGVVNVISIISF